MIAPESQFTALRAPGIAAYTSARRPGILPPHRCCDRQLQQPRRGDTRTQYLTAALQHGVCVEAGISLVALNPKLRIFVPLAAGISHDDGAGSRQAYNAQDTDEGAHSHAGDAPEMTTASEAVEG